MNTVAQIMELPSSYDNYTRLGWYLVPIPPSTKGPQSAGWNLKENCITDAAKMPYGYGAGIAHAYSGTCAIDIDDWDYAVATLRCVGIDLQGLFTAPDAVTIDSGNPGHAKLLYRLPFGIVLPSKKCIYTTGEGIKKNWIDFRCATADSKTVQDVLPPSVHPITQRPYAWGGSGHYSNLPLLPPELLAYWRAIIDAEEKRSINVSGWTVSASWDEIKSALDHISPDVSRDEWITVLMALHYAGTTTNKIDEAFAVADEWSARSLTKYKGQKDIFYSWRGFRPDGGVTLGSLFKMAAQSGWERPMPDVTSLFSPTTDQTTDAESLLASFHTPKPEVDLSLFPAILATRAIEVGKSIGCDPLVPAFAGLAAACAVVDARIRLQVTHDWEVPPVLWLCTIGKPSDKKSPGAKPMMSVLHDIELEDRPAFATRKLLYEAQAATYAAAKKNYLATAGSSEFILSNGTVNLPDNIDSLPGVPNEPVAPHPLRLTVSDITSQKLVRMCADRPQGVLCHLDEMNSWAKKMSGINTGESRSSWIYGYDCKSETMDRVGGSNSNENNNVLADNFAVSIYGNMQPNVFRAHFKQLSEDGLLQRFIPAILRPEITSKGKSIPIKDTQHSNYEAYIRRIHSLPPITYQLSPEADLAFDQFRDWYIELSHIEQILSADVEYGTALGKLEGNCARLILMWHLFENPHSIFVDGDTARRAIAFTKSYLVRALQYAYGEVGGANTDSFDHVITEMVLQHAGENATISLSDIRRSMRRRIEGLSPSAVDQSICDTMHMLEQCNWVRKLEKAHPKANHWAIDPRLADKDKRRRSIVVTAKQRRIDLFNDQLGGEYNRQRAVGYG
jgi:hypothetical protein